MAVSDEHPEDGGVFRSGRSAKMRNMFSRRLILFLLSKQYLVMVWKDCHAKLPFCRLLCLKTSPVAAF